MTKYEIMLVVNGKLKQEEAKAVAVNLQKSIEAAKKIELTELGLRDLAYVIDKIDQGHYFLFNFESDKPEIIKEFARLANIDTKNVLRHLIINLEKDYGYRAINNPKKVKRSETKEKIYVVKKAKADAEYKAKKEARIAAYEASLAASKANNE